MCNKIWQLWAMLTAKNTLIQIISFQYLLDLTTDPSYIVHKHTQHIHTHTHIHTRAHTHNTCTHTQHMHTRTHTHTTHVHTHNTCTHRQTHTHTHIHTNNTCIMKLYAYGTYMYIAHSYVARIQALVWPRLNQHLTHYKLSEDNYKYTHSHTQACIHKLQLHGCTWLAQSKKQILL